MKFKRQKNRRKFLRAMAFGFSGTGKTVFAMSFPDPLMIDIDVHGSQNADKNRHDWLPEDFPYEEIRNPLDAIRYVKELKDDGFLMDPQKDGVSSIIADPVSKLWKAIYDDFSKTKGKDDEMGFQKKAKGQLEWVQIKSAFSKFTLPLAGANANVIFTAQTTRDKQENTKAKVTDEIYYEVDLVLEFLPPDDERTKKYGFPCAIIRRDRTSSPFKEGQCVHDPRFAMWQPYLNNLPNSKTTIPPSTDDGPTVKEKVEACLKDETIIKLAGQLGIDPKGLRTTAETYNGDLKVVKQRIIDAAVKSCVQSEDVQRLAKELKLTEEQLDVSLRKYDGHIDTVIDAMEGALKQ